MIRRSRSATTTVVEPEKVAARLDDGLGLAEEAGSPPAGRCLADAGRHGEPLGHRQRTAALRVAEPGVRLGQRDGGHADEDDAARSASCIASIRPASVHRRSRMPTSQTATRALTGRLCLPPAGRASTA